MREANSQEGGPIFCTCHIEIFLRCKQVELFILSKSLLLRESQFNVVNWLKSFDLKLFFVYTLLRGPFWHLHTILFVIKYVISN